MFFEAWVYFLLSLEVKARKTAAHFFCLTWKSEESIWFVHVYASQQPVKKSVSHILSSLIPLLILSETTKRMSSEEIPQMRNFQSKYACSFPVE